MLDHHSKEELQQILETAAPQDFAFFIALNQADAVPAAELFSLLCHLSHDRLRDCYGSGSDIDHSVIIASRPAGPIQ